MTVRRIEEEEVHELVKVSDGVLAKLQNNFQGFCIREIIAGFCRAFICRLVGKEPDNFDEDSIDIIDRFLCKEIESIVVMDDYGSITLVWSCDPRPLVCDCELPIAS